MSGRRSSEPTYEGLKPGSGGGTRTRSLRSEPTYEGLKLLFFDDGATVRKSFGAYLRGIETRTGRFGPARFDPVRSLPTRD